MKGRIEDDEHGNQLNITTTLSGMATADPTGVVQVDRPATRPVGSPVSRVARGRGIAAILLAAVIWSSSFAVTKVALGGVPPLTIGALRFVAAAIILGVIVHLRHGFRVPTGRERLLIGAAGLLGITAYFALENIGVGWASASDATLIVASYPIITLVIELLMKRASFSFVRLLGMLLAVGGVWLIVQQGSAQAGSNRLVGDLVLVLGGVVWAIYNLVSQRDRSGASPMVITYYQTLAGATGFILLSLAESSEWTVPSAADIFRMGYLAVFCSVIAFVLYNYGLKQVSPSVAVSLLNIVPVAGLFWAVLLAGETLVATQLIGGAVVIAGVLVGLRRGPADSSEKRKGKPT